MAPVLDRLAAELRAEGGLIAAAVEEPPAGTNAPLGALAAAGPRAAADPAEYALIVEAVREGHLLHRGDGRVIRTSDRDLALLAGDRLYALGLDRLAALGDLQAVSELADVIALSAQAGVARDDDLAEAVWEAGAIAVGRGSGPDHEGAKASARAGEPGAAAALRAAARQVSG